MGVIYFIKAKITIKLKTALKLFELKAKSKGLTKIIVSFVEQKEN